MPDRRTFWPTVSVGAGAAGLAAAAAARPWATATATVAGNTQDASAKGSDVAPLGLALALVALAAWGAVLVLRSRGRRAAAGLGLLTAVGTLVAAVVAADTARADAIDLVGAPEFAEASLTGWYFVTVAAAAVTALLFVVAVLKAGAWPEMAGRYDAPGATAPGTADQADLWKSLDEGHDPTA